ncbi:MAG: DNA-processing protein DprA [Rhodococcus sp. (in: high G+C Gram-positive bacteria)]
MIAADSDSPQSLPISPARSKLALMEPDENETATLLALLEARPARMTWHDVATEVSVRGTATAIWDEFYPPMLDGRNDRDGLIRAAMDNLAEWRERGYTLLTVLDRRYPTKLRTIHQTPPFLFVSGELDPRMHAVSVVGSRDASQRGIDMATRIAEGLAERQITVLSGLAAGIDTAAHTATLRAGGTPVGVIGTGIDQCYPAANRTLHGEVSAKGAVVSQFWPGSPPRKYNFPMRNATMSGLGIASIVVEAGEHSGARIQARVAVEHGRPIILSDMVVRTTNWAKDLLGRPGVFEAGGTAEVMTLVEGFINEERGGSTPPTLREFALL